MADRIYHRGNTWSMGIQRDTAAATAGFARLAMIVALLAGCDQEPDRLPREGERQEHGWESQLSRTLAEEEPDRDGPICLAVDKDAPWRLFVGFAEAAESAGVFEFHLVFKKITDQELSGPPSSIERTAIERLKHSKERAERDELRQWLLERAVGAGCESAARAFSTITGNDSRYAGQALEQSLPRELAECGCAVRDVELLESLIWAELYGRRHLDVRIELADCTARCGKYRSNLVLNDPELKWSTAYEHDVLGSVGKGWNYFQFGVDGADERTPPRG